MRIGRTLPPSAAPIAWSDLAYGLLGIAKPERAIERLRRELKLYFRAEHICLTSSGTVALTTVLRALARLSPRTEVVIPAYTCFSVPAAVLKAGLQPVLCDIGAATFEYDHARLERVVSDRTLCVVAQHLFGIPSDLARVRSLCAKRQAFLVEDVAQAMGAQWHGERLGTIGDAGIFSLGRGKNITAGSGGMIVTRSDAIGRAIEHEQQSLERESATETLKDVAILMMMALFGRPRLYWIPAALPFLKLGQTIFPRHIAMKRLSGFSAGALHDWRQRLSVANRRRTTMAGLVADRIAVRLPDDRTSYLRLPVRVHGPKAKEQVCALSNERGLGISGAYPTAISEIPEVRAVIRPERFANAEHAAESIVTLPTHHWVSVHDRQAIAKCVSRFIERPSDADDRRRAS